MQRWIKLPDGRFIDGNRVVIVGRPESFSRYDEDGNDLGIGYRVLIGTDYPRESQISVIGTREEIIALLRSLLGATSAAAVSDADAVDTVAATT